MLSGKVSLLLLGEVPLLQSKLAKSLYDSNSGTTNVYCSDVFDNLLTSCQDTTTGYSQDITHRSSTTPAYGFTFA